MYIPHGNYPKKTGAFNAIKMFPELFRNIEFQDFCYSLKGRVYDFFNAETFLYASLYQNNYGAKLVMLLSAIERSNGRWKPLETLLKERIFKKKLDGCKNGKEARQLLEKEIDKYIQSFGSTRSVIKFYQNNLSSKQKARLIRGIAHLSDYKKRKLNKHVIYKPVVPQRKTFSTDEERIDYELGQRLKHVIYNIRNGFVHQASYIPFPDKKYIKDKILFHYERYESGEPKDEWAIRIPFEDLHELTRVAFMNFWRKQYYK